MSLNNKQPEALVFEDDGHIPNNRLPLLLYRDVLPAGTKPGDLQKQFAKNNWTNTWDNGVYPFHHYHSTSHEVLGIYSGNAQLQWAGKQVRKYWLRPAM